MLIRSTVLDLVRRSSHILFCIRIRIHIEYLIVHYMRFITDLFWFGVTPVAQWVQKEEGAEMQISWINVIVVEFKDASNEEYGGAMLFWLTSFQNPRAPSQASLRRSTWRYPSILEKAGRAFRQSTFSNVHFSRDAALWLYLVGPLIVRCFGRLQSWCESWNEQLIRSLIHPFIHPSIHSFIPLHDLVCCWCFIHVYHIQFCRCSASRNSLRQTKPHFHRGSVKGCARIYMALALMGKQVRTSRIAVLITRISRVSCPKWPTASHYLWHVTDSGHGWCVVSAWRSSKKP